jgi:hypothetical protein
MGTKPNVLGEGNYEATRQYNDATKKFVQSGRVEQAARDAAPRSAKEAAEMKAAEQAALLHAPTTAAHIGEQDANASRGVPPAADANHSNRR